MQHDAQIILPLLNASLQTLADVTTNVMSRKNATSDVTNFQEILHEFRNVQKKHVKKLLKKYEFDMDLFGYSFDLDTMTASCAIRTKNGTICC